MRDHIDDRGREAAAAVRDETAHLDAEAGLDDVIRRSRRRKLVAPVAAVVVLGLLAIPAVGWLLDGSDDVSFEVADAPADPEPEPDEAVEPEPVVPSDEDLLDPEPPVDDESQSADTPDTSEDAPVDEPQPSGTRPLGEFALEDVETEGFPAGGGEVAYLTDVRVAGQEGFDRIVLEFDGEEMSPYRVGYLEPPVQQDGSGDEVDVDGAAFLEIRLTAASGVAFDVEADDGFRLTYDGPDRVRSDTTVLTELVRTGDFEATLTWTAGLQERAPFAVSVLDNPLRLVVDVRTS